MSLTAIADRLWTHWTDSKPSVHRLLVRLAEREAAFEHSFAQSEFESGDAAVLDNLPIACPLRKDEASGRIQFEHDLAADWARFQRLKEIAGDTAQWAPLAGNPFWHSALRMLGQFLLRQPAGQRTAWDDAFESAEKNREAVPLADEVLLDALFLDPNAEAFLEARADMLFENGGARLLRLVKRFDHVASVAGVNAETLGRFRNISLYLEAQFRTPNIGRWPAMARFLDRHRARVAKMASPAIATLCDRWLLAANDPLPWRTRRANLGGEAWIGSRPDYSRAGRSVANATALASTRTRLQKGSRSSKSSLRIERSEPARKNCSRHVPRRLAMAATLWPVGWKG